MNNKDICLKSTGLHKIMTELNESDRKQIRRIFKATEDTKRRIAVLKKTAKEMIKNKLRKDNEK